MSEFKLRMYGLAIYQLMPIQAGIQFQHAVTRYSRKNEKSELYQNWADNHETSIILNGGTTNLNPDKLGTINIYYRTLCENGIICEPFYEPDLGDQMTAIAFIADERVGDKENYPSFKDWIKTVHFESQTREIWIKTVFGGDEKVAFLVDYIRPLPLWK